MASDGDWLPGMTRPTGPALPEPPGKFRQDMHTRRAIKMQPLPYPVELAAWVAKHQAYLDLLLEHDKPRYEAERKRLADEYEAMAAAVFADRAS